MKNETTTCKYRSIRFSKEKYTSLYLNGLKNIDPETALHLARFEGRYLSLNGLESITKDTATQFTVEFPFSRTASGDVSLLPEVRLRSL